MKHAMSKAQEALDVDERRLAAILAADVAGYSQRGCNDKERQVRQALAIALFLKPGWPTAAERAVVARLKIGEDVVDIGSDVGIVGEPLHD